VGATGTQVVEFAIHRCLDEQGVPCEGRNVTVTLETITIAMPSRLVDRAMSLHLRPLRRKLGRFLTLNLSKSGPSVKRKVGPVSANSRTRRLRVALGLLYWLSKPRGKG
jgi:hypothetical protein